MMDANSFAQLESQLQLAGKALLYPPTPNLAVAPRRSRPAIRLSWAVAAVLVALASLLAVPSVRARVMEFLQVGAVRILRPQQPTIQGDLLPRKHKQHTGENVLISVLELDGETTLDDARAQVAFPIDLPSYPADLGQPDRVFLQHMDTGDFVVLAWLDAEGQPSLVEYVVGPGVYLLKGTPDIVKETEVNGQLAFWTGGEYLLQIDGYHQPVQFVAGPALIWANGPLTYRLEAPLSEQEMVRIAESIGK
jgi:hypothetical protein